MHGRRRFLAMSGPAALAIAAGCDRRRTLNLYNWGDYLAPEVVRRFEAEVAGARIVSDYYLSEAELVAKLAAGGRYDVVVPIDYLLSSMQRDGLLAPIDEALPGLEHLDPKLPAWRAKPERGGRLHAIPYLWGTTGIGYDAERVDPPDSWNALFDPRYAGRVSVLDSKGDVMDQALLASGLDINSTDKAKIRAEVWPRLFAQKEIVRAYDSDPARALVAGETWIAQIDSGDLLRAQRNKPSLRYVIPKEGAALWIDYVAVGGHAGAPDLAQRFIELLLRPEIAALNANELRFGTPNASALAQGLVDDADDPNVYPPPDVRARLFESVNWEGSTGALVDELWLALRAG